MPNITFTFFGTDAYAAMALDILEQSGLVPAEVVCAEDKPVGRKMIVTPPPVKVWAEKRNIPVLQPHSLKDFSLPPRDVFIVVFYNKILPQSLIDAPRLGCLNIHPSLLPKLRGPSPVKSAILFEHEAGVSIIKLDDQMDHGPIVAQEKIISWDNPNDIPYNEDLQKLLTIRGTELLIKSLPGYCAGEITLQTQDDSQATFSKKITKQDGELNLADSAEKNVRKIKAFHKWPRAFYFVKKDGKKIRVIVTQAHIENEKLVIETVIPEGKSEMKYEDFLRGFH